MRAAARTKQVLTGPYVPIDVPSLERVGLGDEAALELAAGFASRSATCSTPASTRAPPTSSPLDAAALDPPRAEPGGPARRLARTRSSRPRRRRSSPRRARSTSRAAGGSSRPCRPTTGSSTSSKATRRPALRAAHFLAGLAIVAIEAPNETRGVAIAMPPRWDPEPALLNALLDGLLRQPAHRAGHPRPALRPRPARRDTTTARSCAQLAPLARGAADREPGQVPVDPRQPQRVREHGRRRRPGDRRRAPRRC